MTSDCEHLRTGICRRDSRSHRGYHISPIPGATSNLENSVAGQSLAQPVAELAEIRLALWLVIDLFVFVSSLSVVAQQIVTCHRFPCVVA